MPEEAKRGYQSKPKNKNRKDLKCTERRATQNTCQFLEYAGRIAIRTKIDANNICIEFLHKAAMKLSDV